MSSFQHLQGLRHLLEDLVEVNQRVECGDIVSAKAAVASSKMTKLLNHYHEALSEDGASKISLQAYVAAGGWVGITYSYELSDGFVITGSQTPRRV